MHNIAKTFFPILLLLFAAVVTAQNGKYGLVGSEMCIRDRTTSGK